MSACAEVASVMASDSSSTQMSLIEGDMYTHNIYMYVYVNVHTVHTQYTCVRTYFTYCTYSTYNVHTLHTVHTIHIMYTLYILYMECGVQVWE